MKKKIKISFVGAGRVFDHYFYVMKKFKILDKIQIHSICDNDKKKLDKYKDKINTIFFYNLKDFLKSDLKPDIVFILTPSGHHYIHAKKCLLAGLNVVVEKPITMLISQAEELNRISKRKNKYLGVVFQNRYNKAMVKTKDLLKKKVLGKITNFSVRLMWCRYQSYYNDSWHGRWKYDGGVLNQQAIHHIDAINWLLGPVNKVVSVCNNSLNKLEAEDTSVSLLKMKSGIIGNFQATTAIRPKDMMAEISIYGQKGIIIIGGIALNKFIKVEIYNNKGKKKFFDKNKYSTIVKNGYGYGHKNILDNILKLSSKNIKNVTVSAKEGIKNVILAHAFYKSNESKKWISPNKRNFSKKLGI